MDEMIFYMTTADGETLRVPESKLEEFEKLNSKIMAKQEEQKKVFQETPLHNIVAPSPKKSTNFIKKLFIITYIVFIIVELLFFVPYDKVEIFISKQNVPHTEVIGSGYATMSDITQNEAVTDDKKENAVGKRVNTTQLITNISITTIMAIFIYFFLIRNLNSNQTNSSDESTSTATELSFEINRLKRIVASLQDHNENVDVLFDKLKDVEFMEIALPAPLDINSLAFADEETIAKEQERYVTELYNHLRARISFDIGYEYGQLQNPTHVTLHTISCDDVYSQKEISVTDKNREAILEWRDKLTNSIYRIENIINREHKYVYMTKNEFEKLKNHLTN